VEVNIVLFSSFVPLNIRFGSGNSGALLLEDASRYSADITAFPRTSPTCYSYHYTLLLHLHPRPIHATMPPLTLTRHLQSRLMHSSLPRVEHNCFITSSMYLRTPHPRPARPVRAVCMLVLTSWALVHLARFRPSTFQPPTAVLIIVTWPTRESVSRGKQRVCFLLIN
jgi:hypothetical protein